MPSHSNPYEEWKALARQNLGNVQSRYTGANLMNGAPNPLAAPTPPHINPGGVQQSGYTGANLMSAAPNPFAAPAQAAPVAPGPGSFSQDWMNQGLAAYNAGQRGSDPTRTPGFDPNTFRQTYAGQAGGNRPEDLARFSDATLAGWMPFYDPQQGKYRSMRGAEGWFDKPTECPPGTGPSGPNETDPCTPVGYGGQAAPVAAPAAQVSNGGWAASASPLAGLMATQGATPASKPNANPFTVQPGYQTSGLAAALTPYQAPQQQQKTDGLSGMMMPWQKRKTESTGWFTGMR